MLLWIHSTEQLLGVSFMFLFCVYSHHTRIIIICLSLSSDISDVLTGYAHDQCVCPWRHRCFP
uniref:Uncharacterized protein n=1 Tax=Arundo donax TaxID=35708 RepID=A0A0A9F605_ARUDO